MKSLNQFLKESTATPKELILFFMGWCTEETLEDMKEEEGAEGAKFVRAINKTIKDFIKDNGIKNIEDIKVESSDPDYWDAPYPVEQGDFDFIKDKQEYSLDDYFSFSYKNGKITISSVTDSMFAGDNFDAVISKK